MFRKCKRLARKYWNKLIGKEVKPIVIPDILHDALVDIGIPNAISFSYDAQKKKTLSFVSSMKAEASFDYFYSSSVNQCNIYNSVYACLLLGLYNELNKSSKEEKEQLVAYFDSFQNPKDGMFYDTRIDGDTYRTCNWWGAEHLCPHIIAVYCALGAKPKYEFDWVKKYYDYKVLKDLLDTCDWESAIPNENDIDNKIMNVGVMLQYQRDFWNDKEAGAAVEYLKTYLRGKLKQETGMWGTYDINDKEELPRMIQFSYHLFRIFMYDNEKMLSPKHIIDNIIKSQNKYGGFGASLNSSACEDIDAIDVLIYTANQIDYRKTDIIRCLSYALQFVLTNQNEDGGFVFRRDEEFSYGHHLLSSKKNESGMFPTWFRTLCLAYMARYMGDKNYSFVNAPGY